MIITTRIRRRIALLAAMTLLVIGGMVASGARAASPHGTAGAHSPRPGKSSSKHNQARSASRSARSTPASSTAASPPPPADTNPLMTPYLGDIIHYTQTTECVQAKNAGTTLRSGVSWAQRQLDYPSLWSLGNQGRGQRIAVIDTGVNDVPALAGRVQGTGDFVIPADNGRQDCDGHGTSVAGLIAGAYDPTTGYAGVAPGATILSIRQSSLDYGKKNAKQGSPDATAGTTTTLADAIRLAVDAKATVINISEASCSRPGNLDNTDSAVQGAVNYALAHNVVVVAAAGNVAESGDCTKQNRPGEAPVTLPIPASTRGVLAVGAVDEQGQPATFSIAGSWLGVAAPGVNIIATNPIGGSTGQINELSVQSGPVPLQGTSFAAPYVSGLVALVRNAFPYLTAPQVIERIEATAQHPAAPNSRSGLPEPRNDFVGYGVIDPRAALTAVVPGLPREPSVTPRHGPRVLPAAALRSDPEHHARQIALLGALVVVVVVLAGLVANSARRRRAELDAQQRDTARSRSALNGRAGSRRR